MIRLALEKEIQSLEELLAEANCSLKYEESEHIKWFVAVEDQRVLGTAKIDLVNKEIPIISCIYVGCGSRGQAIGDGIFRATLNFLDKLGYKWVLIKKYPAIEKFLEKMGLEPLNHLSLSIKLHESYGIQGEMYDYCDINLFFNRGCKSRARL